MNTDEMKWIVDIVTTNALRWNFCKSVNETVEINKWWIKNTKWVNWREKQNFDFSQCDLMKSIFTIWMNRPHSDNSLQKLINEMEKSLSASQGALIPHHENVRNFIASVLKAVPSHTNIRIIRNIRKHPWECSLVALSKRRSCLSLLCHHECEAHTACAIQWQWMFNDTNTNVRIIP